MAGQPAPSEDLRARVAEKEAQLVSLMGALDESRARVECLEMLLASTEAQVCSLIAQREANDATHIRTGAMLYEIAELEHARAEGAHKEKSELALSLSAAVETERRRADSARREALQQAADWLEENGYVDGPGEGSAGDALLNDLKAT